MASTVAAEPARGFPLIAFACETDADLLPHFVRWYRRLGVDRFRLVMHGSWSAASLATIDSLPGVECVRRVEGTFCKELKCAELTAIARRHVGEWAVVVDADEFLELPVPSLREMVDVLEAAGVDELYASLLQRVAADGSLPEVDADDDLDALFPMMHPGLTEDMGVQPPAWKSKYPFARIGPEFVYQRGNHLPGNSRSVAHVPVRAVLHHFKWRSRLFEALTRERGEGENAGEMAVYGRYLAAHGRLPMEGAKRCSTPVLEADGWLRQPTADETRILVSLSEEREAGRRANLRVGFVTFELGGPGTANGGIATAMSALAKLQAAHGVQVEVFYCPFRQPGPLPPLWFEYWAAFGVKLHFIDRVEEETGRHLGTHEVEAAILGAVRGAGRFDVLHFHDAQGFAAPFAMLKAAGLDFLDTTVAITTHGGTRWHNEPNGTPWDEIAYRHELFAQRLCDVVVSPSRYLIEWNRTLDALPERHVVLPNVLEPESKSFARPHGRVIVPECLAFFGRVELRKGFDLFLAALRELAATTPLRPDVLVLGRFGTGYSRQRFDDEIRGLPFRVTHHDRLNPPEALRLLRDRRALAIMPSRQENSPYVAYEAMENRLPFLVSFTGGTAELIHPEDRRRAELPLEPGAMARRIADCLQHGLEPARLTLDPLEIELRNLVTWRSFAAERGRGSTARPEPAFSRYELSDWRDAARLPKDDLVALVPEGVAADPAMLAGMARLLAAAPTADMVEPCCRVVERETGWEMTSLRLKDRVSPREAAVVAGPMPSVVRAGTLASVAPALAAAGPDALYGSLVAAVQDSGGEVLAIPVESHTAFVGTSVERRALLARVRPRIVLGKAEERPPKERGEIWQLCGMLSSDPFVAISMFTPDTPYGALSLWPAAFLERPSLHLITLGTSLLWAVPEMIPARIAEARERWPLARIRILAADAGELGALQAAGVPAILGNLNMFVDERVFHPGRSDTVSPTMDAICIGPLEASGNHALARLVPSLGIVHHRYDGMDDVGSDVRRLLPRATYLNDSRLHPEGYFHPPPTRLADWIRGSASALALSSGGGTCPDTVQCLLCGTPVVSVPNVGGRDHFLSSPHAVVTTPTAEDVAAAVAAFVARGFSRREMHEATKRRLVEARGRFVDDVNAAVRDLFGPGHAIDDVSGLVGGACQYRRTIDALRAPGSAHEAGWRAGGESSSASFRRWIRWPGRLRSPTRRSSRDHGPRP